MSLPSPTVRNDDDHDALPALPGVRGDAPQAPASSPPAQAPRFIGRQQNGAPGCPARNGRSVLSRPEGLASARLLATVDVRDRPPLGAGSKFSSTTWRACQRSHFSDPQYQRWARMLQVESDPLLERWAGWTQGGDLIHRKAWEWAAILEAGRLGGVLVPGKRAIGFGVGTEPIAAVLASLGLSVLATDAPTGDIAETWGAGGQHADSLAGVARPEICSPADFERLVSFRPVDMNALPDDLDYGAFDFVWSSCVIEHLGSPQRGMDFVAESARLLAPGGVLVHTTEYELTRQRATRDYGHMAVFRKEDLLALAHRFRSWGYQVELDLGVSLASPEDRWISSLLVPHVYPDGRVPDDYAEPVHLRLAVGDSVSTSYVIAVQRPSGLPGLLRKARLATRNWWPTQDLTWAADESACTPGSVHGRLAASRWAAIHLRPAVADRLMRSTRRLGRAALERLRSSRRSARGRSAGPF